MRRIRSATHTQSTPRRPSRQELPPGPSSPAPRLQDRSGRIPLHGPFCTPIRAGVSPWRSARQGRAFTAFRQSTARLNGVPAISARQGRALTAHCQSLPRGREGGGTRPCASPAKTSALVGAGVLSDRDTSAAEPRGPSAGPRRARLVLFLFCASNPWPWHAPPA